MLSLPHSSASCAKPRPRTRDSSLFFAGYTADSSDLLEDLCAYTARCMFSAKLRYAGPLRMFGQSRLKCYSSSPFQEVNSRW